MLSGVAGITPEPSLTTRVLTSVHVSPPVGDRGEAREWVGRGDNKVSCYPGTGILASSDEATARGAVT